MTVTWSTHISPSKWKRVRQELIGNRLTLPYVSGVGFNRKTGYRASNQYYQEQSHLVIRIDYPGEIEEFSGGAICTMLDRLFESKGSMIMS